MRGRVKGSALGAVLLGMLTGCGGADRGIDRGTEQGLSGELLVGAAMSMYLVTHQVAQAFQAQHPEVSIHFTHAGSGALESQIVAGAPIDVFVPAAMHHMDNLEALGLLHSPGRPLLGNQVALVVPSTSELSLTSFEDLATHELTWLGMGNPAFVPIGYFAHELLQYYGAEALLTQAVLGNDTREVLQWVAQGVVDAGIVFYTDALSIEGVQVIATAPTHAHSPAVNPVGIVAGTANLTVAEAFVDFLFTPVAGELFTNAGFRLIHP